MTHLQLPRNNKQVNNIAIALETFRTLFCTDKNVHPCVQGLQTVLSKNVYTPSIEGGVV